MEGNTIIFSKIIDFNSIDNELIKIKELEDLKCEKNFIFDLSNLEFISPSGLCYLSSFIISLKNKNIDVSIIHPKKVEVLNYLFKINFYTVSNITINESNINLDNTQIKSSIKIQNLDTNSENSNEITNDLLKMFNNELKGYDKMIIDTVKYSISEIIDNTIKHSNSHIGSWFCAQTYENKLEICILDCGIGITKSLKNENNIHKEKIKEFKEDKKFINYAIGKGITSKTQKDGGHSGEGLFFTTEFIKENNGRIKIISGNGLLSISNFGNIELYDIKYNWKGTIVIIELNLNKPINIKKIFDREFPENSDEFNENDLNELFNNY